MAKVAASGAAERARARTKSTIREYLEAIVLAAILTIVIRGLVIQAFRIPTGSMEDTLQVGDFLFVNKMIYGSEIDIGFSGNRLVYYRFPSIRDPKPGDIIVFRYPDDPARDFIKRCFAASTRWTNQTTLSGTAQPMTLQAAAAWSRLPIRMGISASAALMSSSRRVSTSAPMLSFWSCRSASFSNSLATTWESRSTSSASRGWPDCTSW